MTELEFGARLKMLRQNKHLTQQELADQLGVSNKSVSRWESGGYPDVTTLVPLAAALGVSVDELMGARPPVRSFGRSDWQNLMSYAFALGGGVVLFLLDLFMPSAACYLIYLAMMAYGIYLQRHYTYHSRWFYGTNAVMNFVVNVQLLRFLFLSSVTYMEQLASYVLQQITKGASESSLVEYFLHWAEICAPWFLTALALTLVTQGVIWRTSGKKLPAYRIYLSWSYFVAKKAVPALIPGVLTLFWLVYGAAGPLPEWCYTQQNALFFSLWAAVFLLGMVFLLATKQWGMLCPFLTLMTGCVCFPRLASQVQLFSKLTGKLLLADPKYNATVYVHFGQLGGPLFLACAALTVLYLLCCCVKLTPKTDA